MARAHELAGAPPYERVEVEPLVTAATADEDADAAAQTPLQAVRLSAVHVSGIESLRNGESDLELRFSDAGLDLLKASSGAAIGRLLWSEIHSVDVREPTAGPAAGAARTGAPCPGPERPGRLSAARYDLRAGQPAS